MQFRSQASFDPAEMRSLEEHLHTLESNQLKEALRRLVPEYQPHLD
jgi:hypothetical protein